MSASDVIRQAFAAYRAWGLYLVALTTVFYVALGVVMLVAGSAFGLVAVELVFGFAVCWGAALVIDAVAAFEEPTADRSISGRIGALAPYLGTLTAVWIVTSLIIGIGFVLLIVPGLILLTWWWLVVPVVVLERLEIGAAMSRSKALVSGRGLTVFGTLFMAGVFTLVPWFAVGMALEGFAPSPLAASVVSAVLVGALTTPFVALCQVVLYADLRARLA